MLAEMHTKQPVEHFKQTLLFRKYPLMQELQLRMERGLHLAHPFAHFMQELELIACVKPISQPPASQLYAPAEIQLRQFMLQLVQTVPLTANPILHALHILWFDEQSMQLESVQAVHCPLKSAKPL